MATRHNYMTVVVLINDKFNIVYLDNVIFYRLQRRNFGSRRRPRYLIFSQFSICCCQNAFASGTLTTYLGLQRSQLANVGSHHCREPRRIAGRRATRPHDQPLTKVCNSSWIDDSIVNKPRLRHAVRSDICSAGDITRGVCLSLPEGGSK